MSNKLGTWMDVPFTFPDGEIRPLWATREFFIRRKDTWLSMVVDQLYRINRFAGAVPGWTVGHHSAAMMSHPSFADQGPEVRLFAALHDFPEVITGDVLRPLKNTGCVNETLLGKIEEFLLCQFYEALGLNFKKSVTSEVADRVYKEDADIVRWERAQGAKETTNGLYASRPRFVVEIQRAVQGVKELMSRKNTSKEAEMYIPQEALDGINRVFDMGAKKYAKNNWLEPNGKRSSEKEMHDSMFHHLAQSFSTKGVDSESGEDHLLHLATRAIMLYTRRTRGVTHDDDI